MFKFINRMLGVLILAAVCFLVITAYPYVRSFFQNSAHVGVFSRVLSEEIRRIGELNTLERTETGALSANWLGADYVTAPYEVRVKYGVDLSSATFDIDPVSGLIMVTLPRAEITAMEFSVGEFKNTGLLSVFRPLEESTRNEIVGAKREELEVKYGEDQQSLREAWDSAAEQLTGLFKAALSDAGDRADDSLLIEFQMPPERRDGAEATDA